MHPKQVLTLILLIYIVADGCDASLTRILRILTQNVDPREKSPEISPSPSPASSLNFAGVGLNKPGQDSSKNTMAPTDPPKVKPTDDLSKETCKLQSSKSCQEQKISACLGYSLTAPKNWFVLVQNDGDSSLKVNMTVTPWNLNYTDIPLTPQEDKKINLTDNLGGSAFRVIFNTEKGNCEILTGGAPASNGNFLRLFHTYYGSHTMRVNGTYLLLASAVIIGGAWACCKLGKRGRHVDGGVPYQELEMGERESAINVAETAEGWDQGWDDDWDEEKAVKSPGGNHLSGNGLSSRSSHRHGWEDDWNDD